MDLLSLTIAFTAGLFVGWFVMKAPAWARRFWVWLKDKIDN